MKQGPQTTRKATQVRSTVIFHTIGQSMKLILDWKHFHYLPWQPIQCLSNISVLFSNSWNFFLNEAPSIPSLDELTKFDKSSKKSSPPAPKGEYLQKDFLFSFENLSFNTVNKSDSD